MSAPTHIGRIQAYIQDRISPRITRFTSRLGFANRNRLTENLHKLKRSDITIDNERALIDQLALTRVLKWRFKDKVNSINGIEHYMLSSRVEPGRLNNFFSGLNETNAEAIERKITADLSSSTNGAFPKLLNRICSLAFYLGTAATVSLGASFFGTTLTSLLEAGIVYAFASKLIVSSLNPRTELGKVVGAGNKLFPPAMAGAAVLLLIAGLHVKENYYPEYSNTRGIVITSNEASLNARVYYQGDIRSTELFEFQGENAAARARLAASQLQEVVDNHDIFRGTILVEGNEVLVTDNHLPGWVPFSTTTVFDLTQDNLDPAARNRLFVSFFNNLWASGVMPSQNDLAEIRIQGLEAQRPYRLHRDPRLRADLDLATLYVQTGNYTKAAQAAQRIIDFDLSVTSARPVYFDEAVFLLSDVHRIQSMESWTSKDLSKAVALLQEQEGNLQSLEAGYRGRYNYELLKTCVIGQQFFPAGNWSGAEACQPDRVAGYRENATFVYNRFTPTFSDNFLAVRAFLQHGKYKVAVNDYDAARNEYQNVLALTDLIKSCYTVTEGNTAENWQRYSPYMSDVDRSIGETVGYDWGLSSFARRCEAGRFLRRDLPFGLNLSAQFNPDLFKVFRAQAYQGMAGIEIRQAERDFENREAHLLAARDHLEQAYNTAREIQQTDIGKFYSGMAEERRTYYEVLVDYAEVLYDLRAIDPVTYPNHPERINQLVSEVINQTHLEPLDIIHLRALQLKGNLELDNQRYAEADQIYQSILANIDQRASRLEQGATLPPHYQQLREIVLLRASILGEISR